MQKSLWQKYNYSKKIKQIDTNIKTDILIIGAGITGITTCYNLLSSNKQIVIIDRNIFFDEITAKSTGKINYLQDLVYQEIDSIYGFQFCKLYFESQKEAIKIIKQNISKLKIDCDFIKNSSSVFTFEEKNKIKFDNERKILDKLNVKYDSSLTKFNQNIKDIITVYDTYVFNPVKYLNGLYEEIKTNKNVKMFKKSMATQIRKEDKYITTVNNYEITSDEIVLACNYPFFTIPFLMPFKTYIEKSFISAYEVSKTKNEDGISYGKNIISYRYNNDRENNEKHFIYLSTSSKLSSKMNFKLDYKINLSTGKVITSKNYKYKWMNMDVKTNDFLPYIGIVSTDHPNVYIATGYNTWGMTNGTIAGKIISDLIQNKKNKYEMVFNTSRGINIKKLKNILKNTIFPNLKSYLVASLHKNISWYDKKVFIKNVNGKRVGIYIDNKGDKHVTLNICPHLKCPLLFNSVDKTWDCPCHGSRFDIDGNSIKGPSCYDIKLNKED